MLKEKVKKKTKFDLATKAEKRVMICKDAIKQIQLGKFIPTNSICFIRGNTIKNAVISDKTVQVQSLLKEDYSCECCAKGGLVLSAIRLRNKIKVGGNIGDKELEKAYTKIPEFSLKQWGLIEAYFEGWVNKHEGVSAFIKLNPSKGYRLELILNNIVKNGGTFKP